MRSYDLWYIPLRTSVGYMVTLTVRNQRPNIQPTISATKYTNAAVGVIVLSIRAHNVTLGLR